MYLFVIGAVYVCMNNVALSRAEVFPHYEWTNVT